MLTARDITNADCSWHYQRWLLVTLPMLTARDITNADCSCLQFSLTIDTVRCTSVRKTMMMMIMMTSNKIIQIWDIQGFTGSKLPPYTITENTIVVSVAKMTMIY